MAVTVIATSGASNANSFATVAEIDTYFEGRVPTSIADQWNAATDDEKAAAAVMSTTWIVALVHWSHFSTTSTQSLPWPQYGQWNRNGWVMIDSTVIPQELKNCQAEIALYLLQEDRIGDFDPIKFGIRGIKAGSINIQFREKIPVESQPSVIPSNLFNLLVPSWIDYIEDESSGTRDLMRA